MTNFSYTVLTNPTFRTMLGIMALRNQQLDLAEEKLKLALDGRSPTATAHHNYAMVLLNKGGTDNLELAISHLKSGIMYG